MARLRGRRLFKLSRFGVTPFDVNYDDTRGVDISALREMPHEKDLAEMNDDKAYAAVPHAAVPRARAILMAPR